MLFVGSVEVTLNSGNLFSVFLKKTSHCEYCVYNDLNSEQPFFDG